MNWIATSSGAAIVLALAFILDASFASKQRYLYARLRLCQRRLSRLSCFSAAEIALQWIERKDSRLLGKRVISFRRIIFCLCGIWIWDLSLARAAKWALPGGANPQAGAYGAVLLFAPFAILGYFAVRGSAIKLLKKPSINKIAVFLIVGTCVVLLVALLAIATYAIGGAILLRMAYDFGASIQELKYGSFLWMYSSIGCANDLFKYYLIPALIYIIGCAGALIIVWVGRLVGNMLVTANVFKPNGKSFFRTIAAILFPLIIVYLLLIIPAWKKTEKAMDGLMLSSGVIFLKVFGKAAFADVPPNPIQMAYVIFTGQDIEDSAYNFMHNSDALFRLNDQATEYFSRPRPNKTIQLPSGKDQGFFHLTYAGSIVFSGDSEFPISISIHDNNRNRDAIQKVLLNNNKFTLEADVLPGMYTVSCVPKSSSSYWNALGPIFFIDSKGDRLEKLDPGPIRLQKKISIVSPRQLITIEENDASLKWESIDGACRYIVTWSSFIPPNSIYESRKRLIVKNSSADLKDLNSLKKYEWEVCAMNENGDRIAYSNQAYFFSRGGRRAFVSSALDTLHAGTPSLGISLSPFVVEAEGVGVMGVNKNSPAQKAGIMEGDVLLSFNEKPLNSVFHQEFVKMVQKCAINQVVPIEYSRNGIKYKTKITIEAAP